MTSDDIVFGFFFFLKPFSDIIKLDNEDVVAVP